MLTWGSTNIGQIIIESFVNSFKLRKNNKMLSKDSHHFYRDCLK